ncbi:hypothetical protein RhiJN_20711 [Ceratobasidium sp. AG-Ba]|nr:hypothetical protein RhiJN_20711 [Ceratobasidium sp. AG-Ba]
MCSSESSLLEEPKAILKLHGVVVAIGDAQEDDNTLPGYRLVEDQDTKVAKCWVPAIPGSSFCIHVAYEGTSLPFPDARLFFEVYLDGIEMFSSAIESETLLARIRQIKKGQEITEGDLEVEGHSLPDGRIQPFCFSLRPTSEKDDGPPENFKRFGSIRVAVYWVAAGPEVKQETPALQETLEEKLERLSAPVNEKLIGSRPRCIATLGDPKPDANSAERRTRFLRLRSSTYEKIGSEKLLFCFKYEDKGGVQPNHNETIIQH